jgi:hypothetical protein
MAEQLYDVLAVNIKSGLTRVVAESKSQRNAERIVEMAVMRRGVEEEFFAEAPAGKFRNGSVWKTEEEIAK